MFLEHLNGKKRFGVYPLRHGLTPWLAVDLDNHDGKASPKTDLAKIVEVAWVLEIPTKVFNSNSGNGYHVFLFFR